MAQNRKFSPRIPDLRTTRPGPGQQYQQTNRAATRPKSSRSRPDWSNSTKTLGAFLTSTTLTAAVAQTQTDVGVPVPGDAIGVIVMVQINSNTGTAGFVSFNAYTTLSDSGGLGNGSVASYRVPNVAGGSHATTLQCPLTNGKLVWDTTVSGAVAYDIILRFCGFIRA